MRLPERTSGCSDEFPAQRSLSGRFPDPEPPGLAVLPPGVRPRLDPWYAGLGAEVLAVGPSVAAFAIALSVGGIDELRDPLRPFLRWRVGLRWWAMAVFGVVLLHLAGLSASLALGGEMPPITMIREELHRLPLNLVLVVPAPWNGPVGEEFGWRGFALPRLQDKHGPLVASPILGTAWGILHLPTFFAPTGVLGALYATLGMGFIVPYTATTIANSIITTWLTTGPVAAPWSPGSSGTPRPASGRRSCSAIRRCRLLATGHTCRPSSRTST